MIDIKPKSVLEQPIYMLTKATSCPYLTGKVEKRIATDISNNKNIYEELSINGFRRVENWMYRPLCDNCSACKSYRVDIEQFKLTKSLKRISKNFENFNFPIIAYQVSGEYSMIKCAIEKGWFDEEKIIFETLMCFKRAGCDGIITYFAPYVAKKLINKVF